MIQYSDTHRIIFVHIHRTGGTSIKASLKQSGVWEHNEGKLTADDCRRYGFPLHLEGEWYHHLLPRHVKKIMGKKADDYEKFAVIRNPWERAVSTWAFLTYHKGFGRSCPEVQKRYQDMGDFPTAVRSEGCVWVPQEAYLRDGFVDTVLRYENYPQCFYDFCTERSIPYRILENRGKTPHRNYREHYDDWSREYIAEQEKWIIENYGYEF